MHELSQNRSRTADWLDFLNTSRPLCDSAKRTGISLSVRRMRRAAAVTEKGRVSTRDVRLQKAHGAVFQSSTVARTSKQMGLPTGVSHYLGWLVLGT